MQVIGFNFHKISGHRTPEFKLGPMNVNIEFTDVEREKLEILKDSDAAKLIFKFSVDYLEAEDKKTPILANILLEGHIKLALSKEESKELTKSWKKKQLPAGLKIPMNNIILKRTAPRALQLQDELGIPSHIPIQQLRPQQNQGQ